MWRDLKIYRCNLPVRYALFAQKHATFKRKMSNNSGSLVECGIYCIVLGTYKF